MAPIFACKQAVQSAGRTVSDNSQLEFEAKSSRDGAWYDVATFLSHRSLKTGDPDVLVRFAGFGLEEDEWVNVPRHVRQRSLPCEASECVAVLPGDLILCFQEGKEQALYFDAHVLDAQRRRHDVRGCRCRFLVRYDHDQSEVGRYKSPDEHPFFPTNLPEPMLPPLLYPQVLHPCASSININSLIWNMYFRDLLPRLVKPGDDGNSGSTAVCDTICLQITV